MNVPKLSEMTTGQKAVYGIGLLGVLAVLGPLAALAAATVTSIFTAACYAVALFTGLALFPAFNRGLKTATLKLMKANARMNPIETLELDFLNKREALERFVKFVISMIAAHKLSQEELDGLKKSFPNRDLSGRQETMDKMHSAVQMLRTKASEAEVKLNIYGEEVAFIKADNAWAKRVSGAMTQLKAVEGVDALDELLKNESIGQVRQNVAMAFAELDMLLEQEGTREVVLQITHNKESDAERVGLEIPQFFQDKAHA